MGMVEGGGCVGFQHCYRFKTACIVCLFCLSCHNVIVLRCFILPKTYAISLPPQKHQTFFCRVSTVAERQSNHCLQDLRGIGVIYQLRLLEKKRSELTNVVTDQEGGGYIQCISAATSQNCSVGSRTQPDPIEMFPYCSCGHGSHM